MRTEGSGMHPAVLTQSSDFLGLFIDFPVLDFPRRPPWSYEMSKEQLMSQEERSFQEYLGKIHGAYTLEKLSYFEHNLEVRMEWGQE